MEGEARVIIGAVNEYIDRRLCVAGRPRSTERTGSSPLYQEQADDYAEGDLAFTFILSWSGQDKTYQNFWKLDPKGLPS